VTAKVSAEQRAASFYESWTWWLFHEW